MKTSRQILFTFLFTVLIGSPVATELIGCSGTQSGGGLGCSNSYPEPSPTFSAPSASNVMTVTVDGSKCSDVTPYTNEPCVSVKICDTTTGTHCQTVNNILLDTGSFGLRIFSQALTIRSDLTAVTNGVNPIGECAEFGTGDDWGEIYLAKVELGDTLGETATSVPIQVIDSTFGTPSGNCTSSNVDTSPSQAMFNGILGVGLLAQDCGILVGGNNNCSTFANNHQYYACSGTTCSGTTIAASNQVTNPISQFSVDNNGLLIEFPAVDQNGDGSVTGYVVFGVGTESNNKPSASTQVYQADGSLNIETQVDGSSSILTAFLDSGSNGLYFEAPSGYLQDCPDVDSAFYCPSCAVNLNANLIGNGGSPSTQFTFQISNFLGLIDTGNAVFSNSGGTYSGFFDWGIPFFYGRQIYLVISGDQDQSVPKVLSGTGPYWAL